MGWADNRARYGLRVCILGVAATATALALTSNAADARRHHRRVHFHFAHHHHSGRVHTRSAEGYSPPSASIVVDGNTGQVLQASEADALRHPASLTKIMTLYLLFERLETGKLRLDTPLMVSAHAAGQAPTKLNVRPGQTVTVEDAIKGVITRSANDVAVVIAENLAGSEDAFATLMTQKAHALGMSRTTYVNASGLPDDDQITTARDQALLGRAIQDHFPHYYRYFSTRSFVFRGTTIRGHNHLLGSVNGVDGIKTGFTRASGFNLVTSVHRDGRYIVGVVLGGRSAFQRDAHMRTLIESNLRLAGGRRTAPVVAERNEQRPEPQRVAVAKPSAARPPQPKITAALPLSRTTVGSNDPMRPLPVKTVSYKTVTVRTASLAPMPMLVPVASAAAPGRPVASQPRAEEQPRAEVTEAPEYAVASASSTPMTEVALARPETAPTAVEKSEPVRAVTAKPVPQSRHHTRNGWLIQIGAFEGEDEARQHLTEARAKLHSALAAADPFTERVQKGEKSLYRARFAGFDKAAAEAVCRQLKHNDFACLAMKD